MKSITLSNGIAIPELGFGTWQTPDGETAINAVKCALKNGYTHIDCAACYGNEKSVGKGIAESGVKREDIFITSKLWNTERGYESTLAAFEKTCKDLGLDYLDLYLIHWPANAKQFENWEEINYQTWRAFEKLYTEGRIKAIGVSNFMPHHLKSLMKSSEIKPMVNQIEYHPGFIQKETVEFCKENNIAVEAWSPLGTGRVLKNEMLKEMAAFYGKSTAQLCIRFCLQNGIIALPKSVTESRIIENLDVFDFEISDKHMEKIRNMGEYGWSGLNADEVDF